MKKMLQLVSQPKEQEEFLRKVVDKSEVELFATFKSPMKQLFLKSLGRRLQEGKHYLPTVTQRFLGWSTELVQTAYNELAIAVDNVASFVEYIKAVKKHAALLVMQRTSEVIMGHHLSREQWIYISPDDQMS